MKKIILSILLVISFCFVQFMACTTSEAKEGEPIKIGVLVALSGYAAAWGLAVHHCVEMWADEVNLDSGLEVNGVKHKIKLITEDSKFDISTAVAGAQKLMHRDGVKFIHGPVGSHTAGAVIPILTGGKVINLHYGWLKDLLAPKYPYSFGAMPTAHEWAKPMYQYFRNAYPEKKKVVTVIKNYSGGHAVIKDVDPAIKTQGFDLIGKVWYETKTKDFYPTITKALSFNPDIIDFTIASSGDGGAMLKVIKQLGFKGITTQQTQTDPATLLSIAGSAAEGHYFMGGGSDEVVATAKMNNYVAEYKRRYGEWNEGASQELYPPLMLGAAIKEAGTFTDTDKVAETLKNVTLKSEYVKGNPSVYFVGRKYYGRKARLIVPMCLVQVRNGAPGTVIILEPIL